MFSAVLIDSEKLLNEITKHLNELYPPEGSVLKAPEMDENSSA